MIIIKDAEKTSDQIQHAFMRNILNKQNTKDISQPR